MQTASSPDGNPPAAFDRRLQVFPAGYSEASLDGRRYGVTVTASADQRRVNLVARELGGTGYVSFNYYRLSNGPPRLKPCEMPAAHVVDFVLRAVPAG